MQRLPYLLIYGIESYTYPQTLENFQFDWLTLTALITIPTVLRLQSTFKEQIFHACQCDKMALQ
jgi:hypothetical protein